MSKQTPEQYLAGRLSGELVVEESVIYTPDEIEEYLEDFFIESPLAKESFKLGTADCLVHVTVSDADPDHYYFVFERTTDGKYLGFAIQHVESGHLNQLKVEKDN